MAAPALISAVQTSGGSNVTSLPAQTATLALPIGTPAFLYIIATSTGTVFNGGTSITDSAGNVYAILQENDDTAAASITAIVYKCPNLTAPITTTTTLPSITTAVARPMAAAWLSGGVGFNAQDGAVQLGSATTGTGPATTTQVPFTAGDQVLAFGATGGSTTTSTSDTGYTQLSLITAAGTSATRQGFIGYYTPASAVTPNITMTGASTAGWSLMALALKAGVAPTGLGMRFCR